MTGKPCGSKDKTYYFRMPWQSLDNINCLLNESTSIMKYAVSIKIESMDFCLQVGEMNIFNEYILKHRYSCFRNKSAENGIVREPQNSAARFAVRKFGTAVARQCN